MPYIHERDWGPFTSNFHHYDTNYMTLMSKWVTFIILYVKLLKNKKKKFEISDNGNTNKQKFVYIKTTHIYVLSFGHKLDYYLNYSVSWSRIIHPHPMPCNSTVPPIVGEIYFPIPLGFGHKIALVNRMSEDKM